MKGAREYFDIIYDAVLGYYGDLTKSGFKEYRHGNFIFTLGQHARGKTFCIDVYDPSKPFNGDNRLNVYGMVDGDRGWTESYGWLIDGPWKDEFELYIESLKAEAARREDERERIKAERLLELGREREIQIAKMKELFK